VTVTMELPDAFWFQEGPGVRNWQFTNSGIKLLNVANITKNGEIDLNKTSRCLSEAEVRDKYTHFLVDVGDLVIASSGISFEEDGLLRTRGAFVEKRHLPLCMNTSTIRFKPKAGLSDLSYLKFWLDSGEFRGQITRLVTGSAQQNFGPSHLKSIHITLPPLEKQACISRRLAKADRLRRARRYALELADTFLLTAFRQRFGPRFKAGRFREFGELVKITGGGTPARERPEFYQGRIPWLTSKDMKGDYIWDTEEHITENAIQESATNLVPAGSILVVVKSKVLMHRLPVAISKVPLCHGQDIKSIQCSGTLQPEFARFVLKFHEGRLLNLARGANTEGLTLPMLEELPVPTVSPSEQEHFAELVTGHERLRAVQREALRQAEHLFASLLDRAFSG
jgi:type I restriction enzyme S subunit